MANLDDETIKRTANKSIKDTFGGIQYSDSGMAIPQYGRPMPQIFGAGSSEGSPPFINSGEPRYGGYGNPGLNIAPSPTAPSPIVPTRENIGMANLPLAQRTSVVPGTAPLASLTSSGGGSSIGDPIRTPLPSTGGDAKPALLGSPGNPYKGIDAMTNVPSGSFSMPGETQPFTKQTYKPIQTGQDANGNPIMSPSTYFGNVGPAPSQKDMDAWRAKGGTADQAMGDQGVWKPAGPDNPAGMRLDMIHRVLDKPWKDESLKRQWLDDQMKQVQDGHDKGAGSVNTSLQRFHEAVQTALDNPTFKNRHRADIAINALHAFSGSQGTEANIAHTMKSTEMLDKPSYHGLFAGQKLYSATPGGKVSEVADNMEALDKKLSSQQKTAEGYKSFMQMHRSYLADFTKLRNSNDFATPEEKFAAMDTATSSFHQGLGMNPALSNVPPDLNRYLVLKARENISPTNPTGKLTPEQVKGYTNIHQNVTKDRYDFIQKYYKAGAGISARPGIPIYPQYNTEVQ